MTVYREMESGTHSEIRESVDQSCPLVTRIAIRNYKSIAACDVRLDPLTFLVGPNGSGKSNFLDVFAFVAESLRHSIEAALDRRNGFKNVCRQSESGENEFGCRVECNIGHSTVWYSFTVQIIGHDVLVSKEICRVFDRNSSANVAHYVIQNGRIVSASIEHPPAAYPHRLYLITVAGFKEFRHVFEALSGMTVYRINPELMRSPCDINSGHFLRPDGENIASVIYGLQSKFPDVKAVIDQYMQLVAPGLKEVRCINLEPEPRLLYLFFLEESANRLGYPFFAKQVSSGTLRALGILTALLQNTNWNGFFRPFVAIEEPEDGLHLAAFGTVIESLILARNYSQIVVSSHSADLLDDKKILAESILAVSKTVFGTQIGSIDEVGRSSIKGQLFTAGELLRSNALQLQLGSNSPNRGLVDLFAGME